MTTKLMEARRMRDESLAEALRIVAHRYAQAGERCVLLANAAIARDERYLNADRALADEACASAWEGLKKAARAFAAGGAS